MKIRINVSMNIKVEMKMRTIDSVLALLIMMITV